MLTHTHKYDYISSKHIPTKWLRMFQLLSTRQTLWFMCSFISRSAEFLNKLRNSVHLASPCARVYSLKILSGPNWESLEEEVYDVSRCEKFVLQLVCASFDKLGVIIFSFSLFCLFFFSMLPFFSSLFLHLTTTFMLVFLLWEWTF